MAAITGFFIGKDFCKVLGLDPSTVRRLVIDVKCDDVVKVYVDRYLQSSETDEILLLLGKAVSDNRVTISKVSDVP